MRFGKDYYKAPDLWDSKVSFTSDLWSIGIILIELTLGEKINKLIKIPPGDS